MLAIWWSKSVITSRMGHRLTLFPLWPLDPQAAAGGRWASSPISALRRGERQLLGKGGGLAGQAPSRPPVLDSARARPRRLGASSGPTNQPVPTAAGRARGWVRVLETGAGCLPGAPPGVRGGRRPSPHVSGQRHGLAPHFLNQPLLFSRFCCAPLGSPRRVLRWVPGDTRGWGAQVLCRETNSALAVGVRSPDPGRPGRRCPWVSVPHPGLPRG